nr:MAG TPA: Protein of unknown function (DUF551) [Caudoviricetes sp.]
MSDFGWIPAEERLPKLYETVIVTTSTNMVTTAFMTIDRRWIYIESKELYFKATVTAWMPLPEPYKEEDRHNGKL